ncbi:hypothetical protein TDB9533_02891 [Thalassocella blandensis]|nr:hypothetical protein TDB9533_02891 [Thalassocella blandensis]
MFEILFLYLLSGNSFYCDQVQPVTYQNEAVPFAMWTGAVCHELSKEYQNVHLSVLRSTQKGMTDKFDVNAKGKVDIEEVGAGRIKVHWQSLNSSDEITFYTKVYAEKNVWVFKRNIEPGKEIKKRYLKKEMRDVYRLSGVKQLLSEAPVGKVSNRRIQKSQIATEDLIREKALVNKNDRVLVVVKNDGLKIQTKGKALTTAWEVDEKVQVYISQTKQSIDGFVKGEKLVYVEN